MNTNATQDNDNQTEQLTDLEAPKAEEVNGGESRSGPGVYKTVDGGQTWTL